MDAFPYLCFLKGQHNEHSLFPRSWLTRLAVTFEVVRPERPQLMQNCRTIASFPVQSPAIMDLEGSPLASLWIELLGCTSFSLLHLLLHSCTRDTRLHRVPALHQVLLQFHHGSYLQLCNWWFIAVLQIKNDCWFHLLSIPTWIAGFPISHFQNWGNNEMKHL